MDKVIMVDMIRKMSRVGYRDRARMADRIRVIFRFFNKISLRIKFLPISKPLVLRVSGMSCYAQKCEKIQKSLHPNVDLSRCPKIILCSNIKHPIPRQGMVKFVVCTRKVITLDTSL